MLHFVAVISVYFRPTETPIWAKIEISPKPPISIDTETEICILIKLTLIGLYFALDLIISVIYISPKHEGTLLMEEVGAFPFMSVFIATFFR